MTSSNTYPGDEIVPQPLAAATHAIEITTSQGEIWPWIVQMGYQRAGWYIDAWWDKLINEKFWPLIVPEEARPEYHPSAEEIVPELQDLKVGDIVLDGPPGTAFYNVVGVEPDHYLLLRSDSHFKYILPSFTTGTRFEPNGVWSWAFVMEEIEEGRTRLTIRFRGDGHPRGILTMLKPVIFIANIFHVREMLNGVKRRAEGNVHVGE